MQGKKKILANFLYHSRMADIFTKYPLHNKLIILNYHRIKSNNQSFNSAFDDGVYTTDIDQFASQILWLKRNTNILSQKELVNCFGEEKKINFSRPCVLITFDDGYHDNYTLAYPILKTLHVPAVFFLTTNMLSNRQLSWWDIIAYMFKKSERPFFIYEDQTFDLQTNKLKTTHYFLDMMKTFPAARSKHLLAELSEMLEVDFPSLGMQSSEIMTWDHVREMMKNGMEVGSHTHTHRVLTSLDEMEIREELLLSKMIIERETGEPVISVSYPVGEPQLVARETEGIAAECGYVLGFTTNSGVNSWGNIKQYYIRRTACLLEDVTTVSLMTLFPDVFLWESKSTIKKHPASPTHADAHYQQGLVHLGQNQLADAVSSFAQALKINPNYLEARIKMGLSLLVSGQLEESITHLDNILERYPHFSDINYYLGIAYAHLRQFERAKQFFFQAVTLNRKYSDALLKLMTIQCLLGEYSEGFSSLERLVQLKPGDEYLCQLLEVCKAVETRFGFDSNEFRQAICPMNNDRASLERMVEEFYKTIHISPNMVDLTFLVSRNELTKGQPDFLIKFYEEYVQRFDAYPDAHYSLGEVYFRTGDLEKAQYSLETALERNPMYMRARLRLFEVYCKQKNWQQVVNQGVILDCKNISYPDIHTEIAQAYLKLGQGLLSKKHIEKALDVKPDYNPALELLNEIHRREQRG